MTNSHAPLTGIRILDFTAMLPGAICTLHLADLGADVIKIEPPITGEAARGPAGTPPGGLFHVTNRNKRSFAIDLKASGAAAQIERLVEKADVVVEGFRPGVMARLGLGYEHLRAINPKLVYCSITGYGQEGPLSQKGGHDINYQCVAGAAAQNVTDGGRPSPGGVPIADLGGGSLSSALAILSALFDAQRTGSGRYIDISMADCAMSLNVAALSSKMIFGGKQPVPGRDILSGGLPCYRTYETSDGRYLAVGAIEHKFWRNFCATLGRPDLETKGWDMGSAYDVTVAEISSIVATRTLSEWSDAFSAVDACVTPVLDLDESLSSDHAGARGMVIEVEGGGAKTLQYAQPIKMTGYSFEVRLPPPAIGEHNEEIEALLS